MNIHFEVDQIVRAAGSPFTYKVKGFLFELVECQDVKGGNPVFFHPDQLELFTYEREGHVPYSVGDQVRAFGYEGIWTVLYFTKSRLHDDLLAVIENLDGACHPVLAHYVRHHRSPMQEGILQ